jgi:hypothetical protein
MPPKTHRSYDPMAADRCLCQHLVYMNDTPGGTCQFCGCENHQSANRPAEPKAGGGEQ